jgi:DNA-binding LacI/PurR family transcriptional regulator
MDAAVGRLAEAGHRRIALFLPSPDTRAGAERERVFLEALSRRGFPPGEVFGNAGPRDFAAATSASAATAAAPPSAFVAAGEDAGLTLARMLRLRGIRIPESASLVAMEHAGVSDKLDPPHTTLVQDFPALARRAVSIALGENADAGAPLPYGFIERSSVREYA